MGLIGNKPNQVPRNADLGELAFFDKVALNNEFATLSSNTTIQKSGRFFVDTTSSALTITLPATPTINAIITFADYAGTWATNNVTVSRNSKKILGLNEDLILNVKNGTVTIAYADENKGWINVCI